MSYKWVESGNTNSKVLTSITGKCNKCNTEGGMERTWGWNDDPKLQRYICKECECKYLDKLYELDVNISTEKVLYKKREDSLEES